jgi:hypothetical protein
MSKDKRLEEKEKLDAEILRGLSVVKMKKTHKQIEDIEKLRKKSAILSINERLSLNISITKSIVTTMLEAKKEYKVTFDLEVPADSPLRKPLNQLVATYESIRFDLLRNIDIKEEDFDRLFPKIEVKFRTYDSIANELYCLICQMEDMKTYCMRLL